MVSTPEASGITKQRLHGRDLVQCPCVAFRLADGIAPLVVDIAVDTIAACWQWI